MKHRWLAAVFFIFLSLPLPAHAQAERASAVVSRVIDGDTVVLDNKEHVRLLGINAPEYELWKPYVEPYGKEAAEYLRSRLKGKKVLLEGDQETKDRYGRTLAYVYLSDGTFVNEELVRGGYAQARYYAPNGKYYAKLKAAQKEARDAERGLWKEKLKNKKSRDLVDNFAQKV